MKIIMPVEGCHIWVLQVFFNISEISPAFCYSSLHTVFMCVLLWRLEICKECRGSFCAWIIWISASVIYACWLQTLAPPKSCIIKLLISGSSSFIWLSNLIKDSRMLQKQNAEKKSLCAPWCDQGLCEPVKWTLQKWCWWPHAYCPDSR